MNELLSEDLVAGHSAAFLIYTQKSSWIWITYLLNPCLAHTWSVMTVKSPDLLATITLAVKVHYRPYSHGSRFPHSQCIVVHVGTAGKRTPLSQSIQHTLRNWLLQMTTFTVNTVDIHIKRGETSLSFPPNNGNRTSKINERLIKISYFICPFLSCSG